MWPAVLVASVGCYVIKLVGLSLPKSIVGNRRVMHVAELLPVALLTALIATQTFTSGRHLTFDARAAGLLAAIVAVRLKAPFLVVVAVACAVAAVARLVT
jgi:branched-subunit amino acid transport protein